ncbi:MAG: palindromic element RPE1 domain-containing protein [Rickettsia sp.]|nr:palindromic element RPE1 domain-containing protein [Rickettsia sp.]
MTSFLSWRNSIRPLAEFASAREFAEATESRPAAYLSVREEQSAGSTHKLPTEVELCKRSIICLFILLLSNISIANEALPTKKIAWPFDGVFATVDRKAAQRGFQVYKEVCSSCHGLYNLYYRNLKDIGFLDEEIKEIAKNYTVQDGPNDAGEMFERPALPSDPFVRPYPNEQAARAANNGADPPDLSLIIKARLDGANYLYSILTGYSDPSENFKLMPGLNYNPYFPHSQIAMPAPLSDGQVKYIDGTNSSVEQMAMDVTIFLQWAAEPEMENRKSMGLKVMMFLVIFIIFFYISKNRIWKNLETEEHK